MIPRSPIKTRSRGTQSPPRDLNPNNSALLGVRKHPVAPAISSASRSASPTQESKKNDGPPSQEQAGLSESAPTNEQTTSAENPLLANGADVLAATFPTEPIPNQAENDPDQAVPAQQLIADNMAEDAENAGANAMPANWAAFAQLLLTHRPALPEFSGLDHEDPEHYLTECDEYLTALHVPAGRRVKVIEKGLKGEAERWWMCYRSMGVDWDRFQNLFRSRFDSQAIKNSLVARLYGTRQNDKDAVGAFLQHKYMLYQRLRPDEDEVTKIATLVGLLRPTIRKVLRAQAFADFSELLSKAIEAEKDDEEEQRAQGRSKTRTDGAEAKPKNDKNDRPPKCWHCPEYHLHRDCPELKKKKSLPENWRAAEGSPAAPAEKK